jgi:hypothetical protein
LEHDVPFFFYHIGFGAKFKEQLQNKTKDEA